MADGKKNPANKPKTGDGTAEKQKFQMQELPVVNGSGGEYPEEELTYIAYGERGEDVAFELSENLEEAVEIYESMKEDGFKVKLFQAQELEIVDN
jgi:hypothetical protein